MDISNREIFHLKRRVEALKGLINDQFYTLVEFCQTLPLGGEELMEQLLRQFAVYHTRNSLNSKLFTDFHSLPDKELSAIEVLEFVYDIHIKEKLVEKKGKRIEGDDNKFTVYYARKSCFYNAHCENLVCDGLSCICVRRFFYEGMIKVMANQEYISTIDTPLLDQEFCAFTFEKQKVASEKPEKIEYRISETIKENLQLRQATQEKLKRSETSLKKAQEIGHIGTWDWNPNSGELIWSDEIYCILGLEADAVMPTYELFLDMVHPDDRDFLNRSVKAALYENKPYALDCRIVQKDGSERVAYAHGEVKFDKDGKPLRMIGLFQDITERKQAEAQLEKSSKQLRSSLIGTIQAISKAVEARDPYTAGHQQRVARLARCIAQEMNLDNERIDGLRMGAIIHDIGKINLPAEILSKPLRLTNLEYSLIQGHPQIGYDILKDIEFPWPVADIAHQHHECVDGSGYPQGLKGEEICLEARIVAVADVWPVTVHTGQGWVLTRHWPRSGAVAAAVTIPGRLMSV
jgi:PAS domain S-box-containing protein/putative nucleotidyltransferase with HDIG domain